MEPQKIQERDCLGRGPSTSPGRIKEKIGQFERKFTLSQIQKNIIKASQRPKACLFSSTHSLSVATVQAEAWGQLGQRAAGIRDYARTTRAQGNGITVLDPGGYYAHDGQDFFPSKVELTTWLWIRHQAPGASPLFPLQ